jgi:hypothetical protein
VLGEDFRVIQRAMARKEPGATFHDSESTDESNRKVNTLRILAALLVNGTNIAMNLESRFFAIPGSEYLSNKFDDSSTVKRTMIFGPQYFVGCVMMVEDESLT